jgi:DNA-binding winged helix-turn-helix (wHTH) protein/TolB-like protein/Flp pilus assembly protein TadD
MSSPIKHFYEFDGFRINVSERLLQRGGTDVPLPPKVFDLLLTLVERHGQVVTKDQLIDEVWPDTIVEETNLKVYVSTLRKALGEGAEGPKFIETLPRRGYRFVAAVTRTAQAARPVPELIIEKQAVAHIIIEEQETAPVRPALPAASSPIRITRPRLLALGGILIVLFALGWFWRARWSASAGQVRSLAVLPFRMLTQAQDSEQLGVGLADALITRLSNTGGLVVRPTSTVLKYAATERDPLALGRKIEVDAVLDGHLQRNDDQVRLTVQLLRTDDGTPLWAESFEEKNSNLFVLQRAVSERLAHALTLKLNADQQRKLKQDYTANAAAYEAYTRGRYFYNKQNKESYEKALGYFRQAIELDPRYALAWAGIADCYNAMSTTVISLGATPHRALFTEARAAAQRALELDESLADAHVALGVAMVETDHHVTHRELERALALNPNLAQAYNVYALELIGDGRVEEALAKVERARELDPLSLSINTARGIVLFRGRRYDEAAAQFRKTLELDPNFARAHFVFGMVLEQQRRYDEAIAELQKAVQLSGGGSVPLSALGHVYASAGRRAEAEQVLARMLELYEQKLAAAFYVAVVYAGLGNKEQAFAWLEKNKGMQILTMLRTDPRFDALRDDPRFAALLPL